MYFARIEASRIKEQYGCEPPLGFVRTTKAYTIPANSHIGIHGLTKVKHGGWSVNVVNEKSTNDSIASWIEDREYSQSIESW